MTQVFLRKYGEAATLPITLYEVDGVDMRVDAVYASGDVKITKDEGAETNTTNSFTDEGSKYSIVLTATEMEAARISGIVIDQTATKVWLDTDFVIETYGHASAQHAFDLDTASVAQTADHTAGIADVPTVAEFNARTLLAAAYFDPATDTVANVTTVGSVTSAVTVGTMNAAVINAASIAASALDGKGDWNIVVPDVAGTAPTASEINAEIVDALSVDTYAQPTSALAATASITDILTWVGALFRNKMTQTATTTSLRNDGDTLNISTSTVSDDTTTFTRGEHS